MVDQNTLRRRGAGLIACDPAAASPGYYSRVIAVDRRTRAITWQYRDAPPENFFTPFMGSAQRLPNGNTLVTESAFGRIFEVTRTGQVCWEYVVPFLAPADRPAAFGELARVVRPGGYLVTAFKAGDSRLRRAGHSTGLGVEFDIYWLAPEEMERRVTDAGFTTVFRAGRPPMGEEGSPQGYLLAQRS
jgi:SAM-dependent methyltransferase